MKMPNKDGAGHNEAVLAWIKDQNSLL